MTELLESVAVIAGTEEKWPCPFSHDPTPKSHANDFIGEGSTLGGRLEAGEPTSRNPDYGGNAKLDAELDPRRRPGHPLNKDENRLPINLQWNDLVRPWPVTCAAHHLIPAQASLARSDLLPWLIDKSSPGTIKRGESTANVSGLVQNDVGYDVNGAQNGVWLPGPYAMRGIWTAFVSGVDSEDEPPADAGTAVSAGDGPPETPSSQFDYAVAAMRKARAQFHDSHVEYSKFVLEALNLVAAKMVHIKMTSSCDQCRDKLEKDGIPPPYSLIRRLDGIASRLRMRLEGTPTAWRRNLYTSGRALEYMKRPTHSPPHNG